MQEPENGGNDIKNPRKKCLRWASDGDGDGDDDGVDGDSVDDIKKRWEASREL